MQIGTGITLVMFSIVVIIYLLSEKYKTIKEEKRIETINNLENKRYKYILNVIMRDDTETQIVAYSNKEYDCENIFSIFLNSDLDCIVNREDDGLVLLPKEDIKRYEFTSLELGGN
ncbi:TPA: hypothetical protein I9063_002954 [Clostridium perfringens]|uniref:Uncharacterized protein n=1 Tax=Clostridium perfringens TaxID=1502 RepID=A0AAN5NDR1_CLOPF|nr:hypothetical protein [Clostridium perfringens]MBO3392293.1 hypothetical protein [Clostridium perfringens]MBO3399356.1 hypothetical protein [Clostridium perfringens]MBO3408401.1 hypothetical protein [Clostridium perfringens]MDM0719911.1 hypothetical protein [Clostridium perfringens]MDM0935638.1 hypothetical protein [Clostridium perfringens]